ncbi:MAG: polysaccharide deacetylase family protein [Acidobacteria bacterium]|nr:polysaccharide deacetylase family protein [Acidobacteriota bacterium]
MSERKAAGISFDLDNLWSYLKTHGDPGWDTYPSYLDRLLPDVLDLFGRRGLRVSFFIVGRDAALEKNRAVLKLIAEAGHEAGNHSFDHEPWLHRKTKPEIEAEIGRAETAITEATGLRPRGFRGPGFSWSPDLIEVLAARGYLYDASTFPTFIGPLGRLYYFAQSSLSERQREERRKLFGGATEGLRPVRPYFWRLRGGTTLLEIPVTTLPLLKTPFHLSYLLYLGAISPAAMRTYLRTALTACRTSRTGVSFLLHPLDFLAAADAPGLGFFPAMKLDRRKKRALVLDALDIFSEYFDSLPLGAYAERCFDAPAALPRKALR